VDIPAAALLIWQLMLAVGFGLLGLFIATPLLAVIVVTLRVLWVEPSEERHTWNRRDSAPHDPRAPQPVPAPAPAPEPVVDPDPPRNPDIH
jgi:hypothetical protein